MQFDECISLPAPHSESKRAMELSLRWAERSKKAFIERDGYGLFGIVQGGLEPDLRKISIKNFQDMEGNWFKRGYDQALLLPILSLTEKRRYIDVVCYLYNIDSASIPSNQRDWCEATQIATVNLVRSRGLLK